MVITSRAGSSSAYFRSSRSCGNLDARYSLFVAVWFCGSLTTMSSFVLETSDMIENRQFGNVAINILTNVDLSIGAMFGGRALAKALVKG